MRQSGYKRNRFTKIIASKEPSLSLYCSAQGERMTPAKRMAGSFAILCFMPLWQSPFKDFKHYFRKVQVMLVQEVLIAVITSLVASIIFWFAFNLIPEKRRYNKVRPKVEFDIYEIFTRLGGYIGIALEINEYGGSFSFEPIKTGTASKDDFDFWLQNKCLNASYQFDEMGKSLLLVGNRLEKSATEICDKIEKCATYYSFMTAEEILLLRKISAKVSVYSYNMPAETKVGESVFLPVVPNISYMAENFYELSLLYADLQRLVWAYKKIDRSINKYIVGDFQYNNAQKHYATGDFKKCIKCLKKSNLAAEELKYSLLFRAYYNLNNLPKALSALQQYFEVTKHKTILLVLLDDTHITFDALDEAVFDIIVQNYSDIEMMETFEAVSAGRN